MWQINFCFTITLSYHKNRIPQIKQQSKETPQKLNECAKCKLAKFRGDPSSWWNIKLPLATSSASRTRWVTWSPASAPATTTTTRWGRTEPSCARLPILDFTDKDFFYLLLAQNLLETLENFKDENKFFYKMLNGKKWSFINLFFSMLSTGLRYLCCGCCCSGYPCPVH